MWTRVLPLKYVLRNIIFSWLLNIAPTHPHISMPKCQSYILPMTAAFFRVFIAPPFFLAPVLEPQPWLLLLRMFLFLLLLLLSNQLLVSVFFLLSFLPGRASTWPSPTSRRSSRRRGTAKDIIPSHDFEFILLAFFQSIVTTKKFVSWKLASIALLLLLLMFNCFWATQFKDCYKSTTLARITLSLFRVFNFQ